MNDFTEKTVVADFRSLDAFVEGYAELSRREKHSDKPGYLSRFIFDVNAFEKHYGRSFYKSENPFSDEYRREILDFFEFISGQNYDAKNFEGRREKTDPAGLAGINALIGREGPEDQTYIVKEVLVPLSAKTCLEMGCADGKLLKIIAQNGMYAIGLDASADMCAAARNRLAALGLRGRVIQGEFFDAELIPEEIDTVVFESSLHHCGDPVRLFKGLHRKIAEHGTIVLFHEGIVKSFDRPWGLNYMSMEAIMQIRMRKWLELVYRLDFFEELLSLTGFFLESVRKSPDGSDIYIVKKNPRHKT